MRQLLLIILCMASVARAEGGLEGTYQVIIKKQEEKKKSRWSIYDWLETKKKFALQDRWLALHTSDVAFEGYIGAQLLSSTADIGNAFSEGDLMDSNKAEAGFYYRIFGLQASYIDMADSFDNPGFGWNASAHLRILGTGIQNSNVTLGYGLRHREQTLAFGREEFDNQYAEAALTLYLLSFLGIEASYQHFFAATSKNGAKVDGSRWENALFFEFSFVRLFLSFYQESVQTELGALSASEGDHGWNAGVRLYF